MTSEERAIRKYIDEKKELHKLVLQIIEKTDDEVASDTDFLNLQHFLESHQYEKNKQELERFLRLILSISINHHRQPNFFENIEKILTITSKLYKPIFTNEELFEIFQQSKPILLFLLKTKIIIINELIFKLLISFSEKEGDDLYYYFYPELITIIKSGEIEGINDKIYELKLNEDIESFEKVRQNFENDSKLCSIIREDLIDDFIQYVHKTNVSLSSQIKRSIFETNSMLIEKEPTLIEYAAFFGSIQIMKYLEINRVKLDQSLWLYAVHSDNSEVIQFLIEKEIEVDDRAFSEAIKCHHNSIACYIYENYLEDSTEIMDLSDETILSIYSSENFEFFINEIDGNKVFFSLCQNGYHELVDLYLSLKKQEIDKYKNDQKEKFKIDQIIYNALSECRLDVVYCLLMEFDYIPIYFFESKKTMTKIALPPTIQSISDHAFAQCESLKYISIQSSVKWIGENVFYRCKSLKEISLPSSVTSIEEHSFTGCESLKQISIPSSVTSIENCAFNHCKSLTRITFSNPSSLNLIGNYAFCGCSSLKQIVIPSSVNVIGSRAFSDCSSLLQIDILSSATVIENNTSEGCSSLKQTSSLSSVDSNNFSTFKKCSKFIKIVIQSPVNIIGPSAFEDCTSLKQIVIPSSVNIICDSAFIDCSSLKKIVIPSSVNEISYYAFSNCSSLLQIDIPSSVTVIEDYAFKGCFSLKQISCLSSVTKIGDYAFTGCSSLEQIEIPVVKSVGDYAFFGCSSLKQVTIPSSINRTNLKIPSSANITFV